MTETMSGNSLILPIQQNALLLLFLNYCVRDLIVICHFISYLNWRLKTVYLYGGPLFLLIHIHFGVCIYTRQGRISSGLFSITWAEILLSVLKKRTRKAVFLTVYPMRSTDCIIWDPMRSVYPVYQCIKCTRPSLRWFRTSLPVRV